MRLGKNIHDAFEIVAVTYENVSKLMSFSLKKAVESGEFEPSSQKFLRWKSDNEIDGWLMKSFILLFQNTKDKPMKNKWRKGPIYVMEINLNPFKYDEPMINIAKFEYSDSLSSWSEGVSKSDHSGFFEPLYNDDFSEGDQFSYSSEITDDAYSNRYWGLKRIVGIGVPLAEVSRENAYEKIFCGFKSLINK